MSTPAAPDPRTLYERIVEALKLLEQAKELLLEGLKLAEPPVAEAPPAEEPKPEEPAPEPPAAA